MSVTESGQGSEPGIDGRPSAVRFRLEQRNDTPRPEVPAERFTVAADRTKTDPGEETPGDRDRDRARHRDGVRVGAGDGGGRPSVARSFGGSGAGPLPDRRPRRKQRTLTAEVDATAPFEDEGVDWRAGEGHATFAHAEARLPALVRLGGQAARRGAIGWRDTHIEAYLLVPPQYVGHPRNADGMRRKGNRNG